MIEIWAASALVRDLLLTDNGSNVKAVDCRFTQINLFKWELILAKRDKCRVDMLSLTYYAVGIRQIILQPVNNTANRMISF